MCGNVWHDVFVVRQRCLEQNWLIWQGLQEKGMPPQTCVLKLRSQKADNCCDAKSLCLHRYKAVELWRSDCRNSSIFGLSVFRVRVRVRVLVSVVSVRVRLSGLGLDLPTPMCPQSCLVRIDHSPLQQPVFSPCSDSGWAIWKPVKYGRVQGLI